MPVVCKPIMVSFAFDACLALLRQFQQLTTCCGDTMSRCSGLVIVLQFISHILQMAGRIEVPLYATTADQVVDMEFVRKERASKWFRFQ